MKFHLWACPASLPEAVTFAVCGEVAFVGIEGGCVRQLEGLAGELRQGEGRGGVLGEVVIDQHGVVVGDGNEAPVEGAVEVGAEGDAVADGVIVGFGEWDDVTGIHHADSSVGGVESKTRDGASVVVDLWNGYFEQLASHIPVLFGIFCDKPRCFVMVLSYVFRLREFGLQWWNRNLVVRGIRNVEVVFEKMLFEKRILEGAFKQFKQFVVYFGAGDTFLEAF